MTEPAVPARPAPPTAPATAPVQYPPGDPGAGGATAAGQASPGTAAPAPGGPPGGPGTGGPSTGGPAPGGEAGSSPTGPVPGRPPVVRPRRSDPLTRMGPWAPLAGAVLGLLAGVVAVLLLGGRAEAFAERLALVFLVVGLVMLGAAGALLADEVRLVRRGAREATVRPAWVEATAGLINGLTPARLLLGSSAFVLFLAAYTAR
ncbi:hypothetical protein GCM10027261_07060 [Geodermatophilus arenarius]|uniref:Uncharacterized protein n=1 Tax=Geodermatophilus arenarius TaxID=1137990 RepID=A0ABV9LGP6_9ACTN